MPFSPLFQYQAHVEPVSADAELVTEDRWHVPWSDPVRFRRISAALMAASGNFETLGAVTSEGIFEDKWHFAWSEPIVKTKVGLRTGDQQFSAFPPLSIIDISWFAELSKPRTLQRAGLPPAQQQFFTFQPTPVVSFSWFDWLSDPVRIKRGELAALQQFSATDTAAIPVSRQTNWFAPFSDPVRIKLALKPSLQQFYTGPSRLLPTSTIFGTLSGLETKDVFLLGASAFNPPASAEIGIVDTGFPLTEIGVAVPTVASVSISIQII